MEKRRKKWLLLGLLGLLAGGAGAGVAIPMTIAKDAPEPQTLQEMVDILKFTLHQTLVAKDGKTEADVGKQGENININHIQQILTAQAQSKIDLSKYKNLFDFTFTIANVNTANAQINVEIKAKDQNAKLVNNQTDFEIVNLGQKENTQLQAINLQLQDTRQLVHNQLNISPHVASAEIEDIYHLVEKNILDVPFPVHSTITLANHPVDEINGEITMFVYYTINGAQSKTIKVVLTGFETLASYQQKLSKSIDKYVADQIQLGTPLDARAHLNRPLLEFMDKEQKRAKAAVEDVTLTSRLAAETVYKKQLQQMARIVEIRAKNVPRANDLALIRTIDFLDMITNMVDLTKMPSDYIEMPQLANGVVDVEGKQASYKIDFESYDDEAGVVTFEILTSLGSVNYLQHISVSGFAHL